MENHAMVNLYIGNMAKYVFFFIHILLLTQRFNRIRRAMMGKKVLLGAQDGYVAKTMTTDSYPSQEMSRSRSL